jgi:hypothetical protein
VIARLVIAATLGLAPAAHAQAEPLETGRDARLFVSGVAAAFEGTLTSVSADALAITLRDGAAFTFQASQLERAEVLSSRRNTLRGAIVGLGVGLGTGVGLVVSSGGAGDGEPVSGGAPDEAFGDEFQAWKLIVPAVAGAVVGAFVGYSIRTPRWAPAFVPGAAGAPGDFALTWSGARAW